MKPEELVGKRVTDLREELKMTQQRLGELMAPLLGKSWSRQTVSAAEKGNRAFTATDVYALAHALGARPGQLIGPPVVGETIDLPGGVTLRPEIAQSISKQMSYEEMQETLTNVLLTMQALAKWAEDRKQADDAQQQALEPFWSLMKSIEVRQAQDEEASSGKSEDQADPGR